MTPSLMLLSHRRHHLPPLAALSLLLPSLPPPLSLPTCLAPHRSLLVSLSKSRYILVRTLAHAGIYTYTAAYFSCLCIYEDISGNIINL